MDLQFEAMGWHFDAELSALHRQIQAFGSACTGTVAALSLGSQPR